MTKVFLTGASGFVGGEVIYALHNTKLDNLRIHCLVRGQDKAQKVQDSFPDVVVVQGDLDDAALIRDEVASADIVLNFAQTNHVVSANAIAEGLRLRNIQRSDPALWIQMSGASIYVAEEVASHHFGFASDAVYDDVKDQEKILSLIKGNPKRIVDQLALSQGPSAVRTALIVGPLIYGHGKGPVNQQSIQAPLMAKAMIKIDHGFKLNEGKNVWSHIHVSDLASLVVDLVSAHLDNKAGLWNDDGIYNLESGELAFGDLATVIAQELHAERLIHSADIETIDHKTADSFGPHLSVYWGTNARTQASKGRERLSWRPRGPALIVTIPDMISRL